MTREDAWRPAMTAAEVRAEIADKAEGRHWLGGCWCTKRHQAGEGLTLVRPPWDAARGTENVGAVAS